MGLLSRMAAGVTMMHPAVIRRLSVSVALLDSNCQSVQRRIGSTAEIQRGKCTVATALRRDSSLGALHNFINGVVLKLKVKAPNTLQTLLQKLGRARCPQQGTAKCRCLASH